MECRHSQALRDTYAINLVHPDILNSTDIIDL